VELDPVLQSIDAAVDLAFVSPASGVQTATFLLHRDLELTAVVGSNVSSHDFDPTADNGVAWIPAGGRLMVSFAEPLGEGDSTTIHFEYAGVIDMWEPWSANVFTEEWTELGLYFPWFPYNYDDYGPFTFDVDVDIEPSYELRGIGEYARTASGWRVESKRAVNDIVLMAARDLKTTRVEADGYVVQTHFTSLHDSIATRLARDAVSILQTYANWFGTAATSELALVETKREMGGGYARPGLISLSRLSERTGPEHRTDLMRYLAHEAAHFWWTLAPAASWEDWLNESFAEYSALLILREAFGEEEYRARIEQKQLVSDDVPPIWGFDREDNDAAQDVLYNAGPVLLDQLATRISRDRFVEWCRELVRSEVRSTEHALEVLREMEGAGASEWLESSLRN